MIDYENLNKANEPFADEYLAKMKDLLKTGWFVLGANVDGFENEFKNYHQLQNFVSVASGLDALIFSLILSELPPHSEVIVPTNTYIATILSILRAGHTPVFVEPDLATYNIDPGKIEAAITKRTRALMIVHLYGRACDMTPIMGVKEKYGLTLIEDCAQAHGAKYDGKMVGDFGEYSAFSFYPTKNLGAIGDGGGVGCKNSADLDRLKKLRNYGSSVKYKFDIIGHNSRMDEIQALFLRIKLKSLDSINAKKRKLAALYLKELKKDFILPSEDPRLYHVYHIFNIRHPNRDQIKDHLLANGIGAEVHYPVSPNKQLALKDLNLGSHPISEEIHNTTLSLPISWYHSESDIHKIIETLNKF